MDQKELKDYCTSLVSLSTLEDCKIVIEKFSRFLMVVVNKHHYEDIHKQSEADLKVILQMLLSKTLYINQLLDGIDYKCDDFVSCKLGEDCYGHETFALNRIIDPTIVAMQVRAVFEMLCTFEIIYCVPDTDEKKDIIYYLFQNEGLRYQSRLYSGVTDSKLIEQKDEEQKQIDENVSFIKSTQVYKELSLENQKKIDKILNGKGYRVNIQEKNVETGISWENIPELFNLKHSLLDNIYPHISTYAHPSYISVRNYGVMFDVENPKFLEFAKMEIMFCVTLLSIFIGDYMKVFPAVKEIYLTMDTEDQIILNFYNKMFRGDDYSYSEAWKSLDD